MNPADNVPGGIKCMCGGNSGSLSSYKRHLQQVAAHSNLTSEEIETYVSEARDQYLGTTGEKFCSRQYCEVGSCSAGFSSVSSYVSHLSTVHSMERDSSTIKPKIRTTRDRVDGPGLLCLRCNDAKPWSRRSHLVRHLVSVHELTKEKALSIAFDGDDGDDGGDGGDGGDVGYGDDGVYGGDGGDVSDGGDGGAGSDIGDVETTDATVLKFHDTGRRFVNCLLCDKLLPFTPHVGTHLTKQHGFSLNVAAAAMTSLRSSLMTYDGQILGLGVQVSLKLVDCL